MLQNLLNNRKTSGLILGGLAAYAFYRYSKMTPEQKSKLTDTIKEKATSLFDQFIPGGLKNTAGRNGTNQPMAESTMPGSF